MNIRRPFYWIYDQLKKVIAPGLRYSHYVYEDVLRSQISSETVWLDLGCGRHVLPSWREKEERNLVGRCKALIGIDYDMDSLLDHRAIHLRVRGAITDLPFADDSFDLVTANMVVEHLDQPDAQFREVKRVLKPGGVFIFHTPNSRGYATRMARMVPEKLKGKVIYLLDGRKENDVFETFYRANTREEIESIASKTGLEVVNIKMLVSDAVFGVAPPLAAIELLWIRLLMTRMMKSQRTTILAILRNVADAETKAAPWRPPISGEMEAVGHAATPASAR